jgi:hypothetical protein
MLEISKTVFEDCCAAYEEAFQEVENHLEEYGQLMGNLITSLEVYLQAPDGRIAFIDRQGQKSSLRESMYLEEGVWKLKIAVCMWKDNGERCLVASPSGLYYPSQTVHMTLAVRGTSNLFIVKLDQYSDEFSIKKETEDHDKQDFYAFIAKKIKSHYKNMFRYIIEHGEVPTVIGKI